jgi:RNA polymerase sigma-70 factor (ECF subfamily)
MLLPMSASSSIAPAEATETVGSSGPSPVFATTHWSLVLSAGRNDTTRARDALAALCKTYWPALHAYVRRRGYPPPDAEDLTQEFFARLLEHNWIARADERKGRFRSFLLTALKRFLADEWDKSRAQKRGGGRQPVLLDSKVGGPSDAADPDGGVAADLIYDRQWALALLERTMSRLRAEFTQAGKTREFEQFKGFLTANRKEISYSKAAKAAGLSEGAARVAAHRLRKRYRELFREEIARTVADPGEVEAELRHLIAVLGRV